MNLFNNACANKINIIKRDIDENPRTISNARKSLEIFLSKIKQIKRENPEYSDMQIRDVFYTRLKDIMKKISGVNKSDIYSLKTTEILLKDIDMLYDEIEKKDKSAYVKNAVRGYMYTANIQSNIELLIDDAFRTILVEKNDEYIKQFVKNNLTNEEKIQFKIDVKKILQIYAEEMKQHIKTEYISQLSGIIRILHEEGLLEQYNIRNNSVLENMNLPILKYDISSNGKKPGILDLSNQEFLKRFSIQDLIAMTAFYCNRLVKETINYNNSMYIADKMGLIEKVTEDENYKLDISDEQIREILVQREFLRDISTDIMNEQIKKAEANINNTKQTTSLDLEKSQSRKQAIGEYESDYNSLYNNILLSDFKNDFVSDLDFATYLESDRYNLYFRKNCAIESLMVMLNEMNKSINWGYIIESENGCNSIQNKEKFILMGIDMKGYNMPIKLHIERKQIETFLENYTGSKMLPVYEGKEDMNVEWNGFISTQVLMPLSKEQRKQIKDTTLNRSDYRYHFLEHIKWMMLPNRYPDYLCDHQGNKKERRYVNISSGLICTESQIQK